MNIGIIGMGPRGLSVFERICANIREKEELCDSREKYNIYLFDPYPPGGSVWRKDQSSQLLMNTVASQITLYTDDSVICNGPIINGPSLYEWTKAVYRTPYFRDLEDHIKNEIKRMTPNTYPTRALYGYYLEYAYTNIANQLPMCIKVTAFFTFVSDIEKIGSLYCITSEHDGFSIYVNKIVLALGHTDSKLNHTEHNYFLFAEENKLQYYPPANPADVDLSDVRGGDTVILRGLGLNFFDYLALLTVDRGGEFIKTENNKLKYMSSGREPIMIAGSRRGVPHHARGENQKGASERHHPLFLTEKTIRDLKNKRELAFKKDVWPLVVKEVEATYYATYVRKLYGKKRERAFLEQFLKNNAGKEAVLQEFGIEKEIYFNWDKLSYPHMFKMFDSTLSYHKWLNEYLENDIKESLLGNKDGPLKAALDVLRDMRNEIRLVVDHGGIQAKSYENELRKWYTSFNAYLSIGPPLRRIEEMRALIECGLLTIVGPNATVEADEMDKTFKMSSPFVKNSNYHARILIEARLPNVDITNTSNKLIENLLASGLATEYKISDCHYRFDTGGLAVTEPPNRLIDKTGAPQEDIYAFGVPTEGVHWVTAAGVRPGVNSVTLMEADAIARDIIFGHDPEGVVTVETKGTAKAKTTI